MKPQKHLHKPDLKKLLPYSFVPVVIGLLLLNCDSTISPSNSFIDGPEVKELTVTPNDVNFIQADGFKDTTLTFSVEATVENVTEETALGYALRNKSTQLLIGEGELTPGDQTNIFETVLGIETTTTSFEELIVEVYAYNPNGNGNFFQTSVSISGFSNNPPEILEASNPEEVQRPSSGETSVSFTAKTTDADGQQSIEGVFLRLISQTSGEVSGSPFQLFDNGASQGDQVASDSVYTTRFSISPTNQLQTYDILYYAVDKGGLVSDTVKTTFSIIE